MFTIEFWKGAGERAVKTFLQTFVAVVVAGLGADAVGVSAGLLDVSWLVCTEVSPHWLPSCPWRPQLVMLTSPQARPSKHVAE